jgi:hypothetical protein
VNLVSKKMIYQRPENPMVKVFFNSTSMMSAGSLSGVIKAQSNGATIYTLGNPITTDPITTWTELTDYWDEVDYDPDDEDNNQLWYDTLTFELTNTPDQTAFQVPFSFTAYSSVALAFSPEAENGLGQRITDIIVDNGGTEFTSFALYDDSSEWMVISGPGLNWQGTPITAYMPTRGTYDPGNTSPLYNFSFTPIFTGGGNATITVQGMNGQGNIVDITEMLLAPEVAVDVFPSGFTGNGQIDISQGPDADSRIFKIFMTVDNVRSPSIYLIIQWA